jgi:hypothetical protein
MSGTLQALEPGPKDFWVRVDRKKPTHFFNDIQRDLDDFRNRMHSAGLPVTEYKACVRVVSFRFAGVHRAAVKTALIQALLEGHIDRCFIGPLTISKDEHGRPYIEHPGHLRRRYLDVLPDASRPIAATPAQPPVKSAGPYLITGSEMLQ